MREQPTIQEQASFFDEWNEKHRSAGFDEIEPESKARAERVLRILGSLPINRPMILEVGCGTGWLSQRLLGLGPTTAIDLSPRAIEIARRRGLDVEFIAGDFYKHEFPPGHFDVGVCIEVVSTVPEQPPFIAKLAAAIKPGGYLVLTSQNKFVYNRRLDVRPQQPGNIRQWLSRRELKDLLATEFRILQMTTIRPKEGRGVILRIAHSYKLNRLLGCFLSQAKIDGIKEWLGLGQTWVILAQRLGS
jgi:2-polyprenyl-3-methyl-5-hydroxy-6-metoxy-1,4-benzoquinol methylase